MYISYDMWILFVCTQSKSCYHLVVARYPVFLGEALGLSSVAIWRVFSQLTSTDIYAY